MSALSAPLGSAAYFVPALFAFQNASNDLSLSTEKLASGNRIINVGDDVAGFSVAAGLQSQLSGLNQASSNVAQGLSLLQVAQGGLQQIQDILGSMQSLAIQANSGSLTNTDRGFLQQQFEQYQSTIDSIASSTSFNNLNLLDGTLAGTSTLSADTTNATAATGKITLSANPSAGQTFIINGSTLVAATDFTIGANATATATNLATALGASTKTALSQATYSASSGVVTITARAGGVLGDNFTIDQADSTAAFTTSGGATGVLNKFTLTGGSDNGIHINSTQSTGTIGNNVINTQAQTPASVTLTVSGTVSNGETLQIDNGHGGTVTFTFKTTASSSTDIQIGSSTEATLQNAVKTITQYTSADANNDVYGLRQLSFNVSGNQLVISNRTVGNATEIDGSTPLTISETMTNGTLSAASFNNGTNTGVNTSGITNSNFTGTVQGFSATFVSTNDVSASLSVGGTTYTAAIANTAPGGNTTVRFTASSGDYFDVQLAGGNGSTVNNQTDANTYAARLNSAFAGLTFTQARPLASGFNASGEFSGATVSLQLSSFSTAGTTLSAVSVTAPSSAGGDGTISFTLGGATFKASTGLGGGIGAGETVTFTNTQNSAQKIVFTGGSTALDFSSTGAASSLQSALQSAFNLGSGTNLQIGPSSSDTLNVAIGSAKSATLFSGDSLDISTQAGAVTAEAAVTSALNTIQSLTSSVGALEDQLNSTSANLQQSITGVGAAHSALADTNIVTESTNYAQDTLRANTAIAIIAQAMSLPNSLLTVLHSAGHG